MTLWLDDSMTLWLYDSMTIWLMTLWLYDFMTIWRWLVLTSQLWQGERENDNMITYDYLWLYMDFIWFYMILYDFIWFCMILYDFIWFYVILYDFMWFYVILCDFIWFYMILYDFFYDFIWFYMKLYFILFFMSIYDSIWCRAAAPPLPPPPHGMPSLPVKWVAVLFGLVAFLVFLGCLVWPRPLPPLWSGACGPFGWPRPACVGQCVPQRYGMVAAAW